MGLKVEDVGGGTYEIFTEVAEDNKVEVKAAALDSEEANIDLTLVVGENGLPGGPKSPR